MVLLNMADYGACSEDTWPYKEDPAHVAVSAGGDYEDDDE
jgi:hypothetical protein